MEKIRQRRVRNCLHALTRKQFLDPNTGVYKKITSTGWYLKVKNNNPTFYLDLNTKFQQMHKACFDLTLSKFTDQEKIKEEVETFIEKYGQKK